MLIDWFTVLAQLINFLILVYLLRRFLYKPVLNAIHEREKRVSDQLNTASQQMAQAENARLSYEEKNRELDQKKETLVNEAKAAAEQERQQLLEQAKKEYGDLRKKLRESLAEERNSLDEEIRDRIRDEVFDIARKVLSDLADSALEAQIVAVFLKKLKALSPEDWQVLKKGTRNGQILTVRSAFELGPDQEKAITGTISQLLAENVSLQFQTASGEIAGVELSGQGYRLGWTISDYLHSLEKRIKTLGETELSAAPSEEPLNGHHGK